jgi:hypothetical protein
MAAGTFTVAGRRVRTSSTRRFVAFRVNCAESTDWGTTRGAVTGIEIFKRSDSVATIRTHVQRMGVHSSRYFVVIDTATGEEVRV